MSEEPEIEEIEEECPECQIDVGAGLLLGLCPALVDEGIELDCEKLSLQIEEGKMDFDGLLKRIKKATGGRFKEVFDHIEELVKTPLSLQGE